MELKAEDVRIDYFRTTDQSDFLNQIPKGVRVKHKPTGIVLEETSGRSQYQNRANCLDNLKSLLESLPTQQDLFN